MTTPEQLDELIERKREGHMIVPKSNEEKLTLDLMEIAESFELEPTFDASLINQFKSASEKTIYVPDRDINLDKGNMFFRVLATSAATMIILLIVVLTIPPLRTLAEQIIDFFVPADSNETTVELHLGGSIVTPEQYPLSLDELINHVDFQLPLPAFMPSAYVFDGGSYDPSARVVTLRYRCSAQWSVYIILTQVDQPDTEDLVRREVGMGAEIDEVMIGTVIGQYVRGSWLVVVDPTVVEQAEAAEMGITTDAEAMWENDTQWHQLVWYHEGILYTLMGGTSTEYQSLSCSLDQEDFVTIANGLRSN